MHQTMSWQALDGQHYADGRALWVGLDERRRVLNEEMPLTVLGNRAPLAAYSQAQHGARVYCAAWEEQLLDLARVGQYLAAGEWFRQTNRHGEVWLGQQRYNAGKQWAHRELAISFDAARWELVIRPAGSTAELRRAIKGLDVRTLMGSAAGLAGLPTHQLALPFAAPARLAAISIAA